MEGMDEELDQAVEEEMNAESKEEPGE